MSITERLQKEREIAQARAEELIDNVYEEMRSKAYSEKEQIAINCLLLVSKHLVLRS